MERASPCKQWWKEMLFNRSAGRPMKHSSPIWKIRFIFSHKIKSGCNPVKSCSARLPHIAITYTAKKESTMIRTSLILKTASSISRWILIIKYSIEIIWSSWSLLISYSARCNPLLLRQDNFRFVTQATKIATPPLMGRQKSALILGYRVTARIVISFSNLQIIYSK